MLNRTILVVAPEKYAKQARQLAHQINKKEDFNNAVFWTEKHYQDNEMQLTKDNLIIFIGDAKENKFTKDYIDLIKPVHSDGGICYGYDQNKAFVYADEKHFDSSTFQIIKNLYDKSSIKDAWPLLLPMGPAIFVANSIRKMFKEHRSIANQKELATAAAVQLLLDKGWNQWVNQQAG
ncbi:hypothetical protein PAESOLCIP111_01700 [Paenibacillus solanacearum]|uniref:Uncharacterized protein n=1 Tax=Paenibacillus solanacearum TaxID=2048548 RepID=A0A916JY53_9BACL|nr:hypothetical protein [Paenibacillus solanacearum]CAG7614348.1 hypothetical protein PAESOLCIP111_01700 [Paenibacillus solanacearum]